MTASLLIGRDHQASLLRSAVERTATSHGGLVLVTGEAGIGKTTLVTDVLSRHRGDAHALYATSWESEAVPAYWPWTQIVRGLRDHLGERWTDVPGADAPAIAMLLGAAEDSRPDEFELADAVTRLLAAASRVSPLLVVLDDLHFADPASIELLKFVSQHTWFEHVLFVATYRDVEVDAGHPLRARILPLVAKATVLTLTGLDENGVAELFRSTVGAVPDDAAIAEVARRTGGNPFFVEQTAQLWAAGQPVDATTAGMRDALDRRLEQLDERLLHMLTLASVGGREFHPAVMAQAAGIDVQRIETALDVACQTRLIRRERDRYVFVHDLVREKLYDSMSEAEAARHHGCIVRAVAADDTLQGLMLTTEIAHHAWMAGGDLDAETAVGFLQRAADEVSGCVGAAAAVNLYRRALERCTPDMVRRRVLLRMELADALHWQRDNTAAEAAYDRALEEAEASGDELLFARAAMAWHRAESGPRLRAARARAYRALLGKEIDPGFDDDAFIREMALGFLEQARKRQSADDVGFGLFMMHAVMWGPGTAAARLRIVDELAVVASETGDRHMELFAASLRWVAQLEQGDPAYLEQSRRFAALAEHAGDRWHTAVHIDLSIVDMVRGEFESAERRLREARDMAGGDQMYADMLEHQLRWELPIARGESPESLGPFWRSAFGHWSTDLLAGVTALERGDVDDARRRYDRLDRDGLPDAWSALLLRFEAGLAAALRDATMIAAVRDRLEPHAGEWLIASWGCNVNGPISYWLGVLAAAAGDHDHAAFHFDAAADEADRLDAEPWAERARKARADLAMAVAFDPDEPAVDAVFRRDGGTWTLRFDGRTVHLPHTKGLGDLRVLLSRPGEEIAAAVLLDPEAGPDVEADARLGGDAVLDAEARTRFREHLETLDQAIDTAAAIGDDARAAALDDERQALIDQLRAATGLGGRPRRLGDNAERARKSVTNRIRNTLKKIEAAHPALAGHLRASISTGSSCVYRPGADAPGWKL